MSDVEFRCFIGGLAWSTTDRGLRDAFEKFGRLTEAKVVVDRFSGRSRGFGFITFDDREAMEDAIEAMNGIDLDGRAITVDKAQPGGGRDRDDRDRDRGGRDYGGGRGSNGGGCYQCGKPGHFARECPSGDGGRGDRYGGRDDRYGGGGRDDRYGGGSRDDRYGGGGRDDRYGGGGRDDRYGGGSGRYGPDRNGDRYGGGRSRDVGGRGGAPVGDRYSSYSRDRPGPYDRAGGSYR